MNLDFVRPIIEAYIDAYNHFDIEGMLASLHADVVFENVSSGQVTVATKGNEELRQLATQSSALFSARKQVLRGLTLADKTVTAGIAFEGTLAADLPNGMKKGETIRMFGRTEFTFQGPLIIRIVDVS